MTKASTVMTELGPVPRSTLGFAGATVLVQALVVADVNANEEVLFTELQLADSQGSPLPVSVPTGASFVQNVAVLWNGVEQLKQSAAGPIDLIGSLYEVATNADGTGLYFRESLVAGNVIGLRYSQT